MSNLPVLAPQLTIATPPGTALSPTGAIPLGPAPTIDVGQATYARPQPVAQQSGLGALRNQLNVGNAASAVGTGMSVKDIGRVLSGKATDAAKGAVGALRGGGAAAKGASAAAGAAGNSSAYASLLDDAAVAGAGVADDAAKAGIRGTLGKYAAQFGGGKMMLAKGVGGGLAGSLAGAGLDALDVGGADSVWDDSLTGAAKGAGVGAAFGLPGVIAGAGLGALAENVGTVLGWNAEQDSKVAFNDKLARVGDMTRAVGMPEEARKALGVQADQAIQMIEAQTGQPATAAQRSAILDNVLTLVGQYQTDPDSVLSAIGVKPQMDAQQTLRWQAMINDYMRPFAQEASQTGQLAEASMMAAAQNEPYAPLRQAYEAQAKSLAASNAKAATAVMRSANAVPLVTMADQNRQFQRQIAQLESQVAQSSGGGDDLAALMEG